MLPMQVEPCSWISTLCNGVMKLFGKDHHVALYNNDAYAYIT